MVRGRIRVCFSWDPRSRYKMPPWFPRGRRSRGAVATSPTMPLRVRVYGCCWVCMCVGVRMYQHRSCASKFLDFRTSSGKNQPTPFPDTRQSCLGSAGRFDIGRRTCVMATPFLSATAAIFPNAPLPSARTSALQSRVVWDGLD